jgi:hypothetical protein
MLGILVLVLGLMVWQANVVKAEPMGTAFTYQGRLIDANEPADGQYDFQFKLHGNPCVDDQVGGDINKPDVDVMGGYFTVALDFGSDVFDGNAAWLELRVRPGEYEDLHPLPAVTVTGPSLTAMCIRFPPAMWVSGRQVRSSS